MSDEDKKKKIRIKTEITDPVTNDKFITRTYENNTTDSEIKKGNLYGNLFGGGYSSARSTRKKQSDDENIKNK